MNNISLVSVISIRRFAVIRFLVFIAATALQAFGTHGDASVINLDVNVTNTSSGTYSGQGVVTDVGNDYWNTAAPSAHGGATFSTYSSAPLLLSDGSTTTAVTATFSTASGLSTAQTYDTAFDNQSAQYAHALLNDFLYDNQTGNPGLVNITIGGLQASNSYDLYLYSQNGGYNSSVAQFTFNATPQVVANGPLDNSGFALGGNYTKYAGLVADVNGTISGTVLQLFGTNGGLDGLQVVGSFAVPEPSSMVLLIIGVASLICWARRQHGQSSSTI